VSRLHLFTPEELTPEQAELYAGIATGPRAQGPQHFALRNPDGSLAGPFNALLLSPTLGTALQGLGAAVRYATDLTPRTREIAILTVAARWNSAFERASHESVGLAAGLTADELGELRAGRIPALTDERELASARLAHAMAAGDVDDELWAASRSVLEEKTIFELATLVGYYAALALQLRIFRVDKQEPTT
jgi:4-carboxymuconolactone decarboxylase